MAERVGRYELVALLGEGGMGSVHEARHAVTGRRVAVKLVKRAFAKTDVALRRFAAEARAACQVDHPNVVDVLDVDVEGDQPFMVIELLRGESLEERLGRGTLSAEQLLLIAEPLLEALQQAHDQGILHRDLKPANIFLAEEPQGGTIPKLLDFGIAKFLGSDEESLTATGHLLGTPLYMPPEHIGGEVEPGPSGDLYSFSAVCYEALAGRPPHVGETLPKVLLAISAGTPPALETWGVHPAVAAVIARGLSTHPEDRPQSARELATLLREAVETARQADVDPLEATLATLRAPGSPESETPDTAVDRPKEEGTIRLPQQRRLPLALAVTLAVLVAVGAWVALRPEPTSEAEPPTDARTPSVMTPTTVTSPPSPVPEKATTMPAKTPPETEAATSAVPPGEPTRRRRRATRASTSEPAPAEAPEPETPAPVETAMEPDPARVQGQRTGGLGSDEF